MYSGVVASNVSSVHEHLNIAVEKGVGVGKILEVGCGSGWLLSRLQSPQRELYGMDISGSAARIAKVHATEASTCAANATTLPFKSNSFDWLICLEVLEHIEGDEVIKECLRVLKPGGKALFSVPNAKGVGGRIAGHVRFFTFASSLEYVRQAGFEITSARKMGLYVPILTYACEMLSLATNKNIPLNHPLGISVPESLAITFFIECRKPPL
jgi:2-polyprenyl-3-methyl-5-hydroxy-6-metoxy-1,4-benzoquinol methylase